MSWASSEVVSVLTFLLPGFVSAAVLYLFTSHPKPSEFGSVVQALIFTMVVQTAASLLHLTEWSWLREVDLAVSLVLAVAVGLIAVLVSNHDTLHRLLRLVRLTRETSHPSEWYSAFAHHDCYVVLHMKGDRRLYGWPAEWPSNPERGHFRITYGEWLSEDASQGESEAYELLIPVSEVEIVEFVRTKQHDIRSE